MRLLLEHGRGHRDHQQEPLNSSNLSGASEAQVLDVEADEPGPAAGARAAEAEQGAVDDVGGGYQTIDNVQLSLVRSWPRNGRFREILGPSAQFSFSYCRSRPSVQSTLTKI